MLDEQSRKNEDLQAKVTELKTMLVVSSLPKETDKKIIVSIRIEALKEGMSH